MKYNKIDGLELDQYMRVAKLLEKTEEGIISEELKEAAKSLPSQWTLLDHFLRLYQAIHEGKKHGRNYTVSTFCKECDYHEGVEQGHPICSANDEKEGSATGFDSRSVKNEHGKGEKLCQEKEEVTKWI